MIAPRTSGAFVCLRCELQYARGRVPRIQARRLPHAKFSTTTIQRDALDEFDKAAEPAPEQKKENLESSEKSSEHPLFRIKRPKGQAEVRESIARLGGMKTLGKDAEVLVIRGLEQSSGRRKHVDRPLEPEETPPETDAPSILASLAAEGAVGQDEVNRQLDSLRPKAHGAPDEPNYITEAEFRKLTKVLEEGFTANQLEKYIAAERRNASKAGQSAQKRQSKVKRDLPDKSDASKSAKMILGRSCWTPGTSPESERLPVATGKRGKTNRHVNKRLLVDEILRSVWHSEPLEEIESPGEIELALEPWQIRLLTIPTTAAGTTSTALDRIANVRKARIEVPGSFSGIRITAPKSSAEYAADDIEALLENSVSDKFSIKDWADGKFLDVGRTPATLPRIFPPDVLEMVEKLSGVSFQIQSSSILTMIIRATDKNALEEAKRNLIKLLPLRDPTTRQEIPELRLGGKGAYLAPVAFKNHLNYRHRELDLGRWTYPISRLEQGREPQFFQQEVLAALEDKLGGGLNTQKQPGEHWEHYPSTSLSVTFGHALFPLDKPSPGSELPDPIFSPNIPGPSKILALRDKGMYFLETLEYSFVPSPHSRDNKPLRPFSRYPTFGLKFRVEGGLLHRAMLSFRKQYLDVLLPDQATDMRFNVARRIVHNSPLEDPAIREFSQAVSANILSGERLTAPPTLRIGIPKWTLGIGMDGEDPDSRYDLEEVTYLFTGITHREILFSGDFGGCPLQYHFSREGAVRSTGGSLRLYAPYSPRKKALEHFVKKSFEFTETLTGLAGNKLPLKNFVQDLQWKQQAEKGAAAPGKDSKAVAQKGADGQALGSDGQAKASGALRASPGETIGEQSVDDAVGTVEGLDTGAHASDQVVTNEATLPEEVSDTSKPDPEDDVGTVEGLDTGPHASDQDITNKATLPEEVSETSKPEAEDSTSDKSASSSSSSSSSSS